METLNADYIRGQLQERRGKLKEAIAVSKNTDELRNLLEEVDAALEKITKGTFGQCETCHDPIEPERLVVDPLIHNCIDHLSAAEQRVLEQDLDLANEVQKNLLPKQGMRSHGWETAYHYEPAGAVSGDYCDLIEVGDSLYFFLGDATGKGVAASILMAHLFAIFRSLIHAQHRFEKLMEEANRLFCEGTLSSHFATLVCGRADAGGEVEISNAGHVPPLVINSKGVEAVAPTGIPLGMFCNSNYGTHKFAMETGDNLVLYTDGVTEAQNGAGEFYGEGRLTSLLTSSSSRSAAELIRISLDDFKHFRSGRSKTDDVTIMVVKRV